MKWEHLGNELLLNEKGTGVLPARMWRSKVGGGWFVMMAMGIGFTSAGAFFYPDPDHTWDGSSLDDSANTLLRPALRGAESIPQTLLRPSTSDEN